MPQFIIAPVLRAMSISLPQQKFIVHLFSLWLSIHGRFNYANLSRYSHFQERTFRRWFAKGFDWLEFNQRLLAIMIPPSHQLIAAMDASFIPKSGKHTPGLDRFFNGCASRVEKGLEASAVALVDITANTAYSLSIRQTPAGKKDPDKESRGQSRLDFYLQHLRAVRPSFPVLVQYLAVDGYYANRKFVDGAVALELDVISKLRHDASLCHLYTGPQKSRGRRRMRGEKVNWKELNLALWQDEGEIEKGTRLFTAVVIHNSLKRPIKVALLERTTGKKTSRILLFSTDLNLSGEQLVTFYRARFQIEFLFRDAKGSMGLTHCQSRQAKAIDFHWNAALCALNLAKWQEERCTHRQRFSAQSCKQRNANQRFVEQFITRLGLDLNLIKYHPAYQGLCNYGVIAP